MSKFLIISQVYPPEPAAVGQYLHEVAAAMARRGWDCSVWTANRGYEDPGTRFAPRETLDGVAVRRLPASSFGKRSIPVRLLGQGSFLLQVLFRLLCGARPDRLLISTSPPLMGLVAWLACRLRGVRVTYWLMDLNPDQAVELGVYPPGHLFVRLFDWMNRRILGAAETTIVLDRFMEARVRRKIGEKARIVVLPPWAPEGIQAGETGRKGERDEENAFRREHGLSGKTVFMYSGNHSWVHPLTTVLEAARRMGDREDRIFVFVGGGKGKEEVDSFIAEHRPAHMMSLPYQSLEDLPISLAAADVHMVAMGDAMVGCVHPCKIYGVLALGCPVLALGPRESHIGEIVEGGGLGERVDHGDTDGAARAMERLAELDPETRATIRQRAADLMDKRFNREGLVDRLCRLIADGGKNERR